MFYIKNIHYILKGGKNMCKIADYPGLYIKANELLRVEGISSEMPGYEFLKRAIVIFKVEGPQPKKQFLAEIKNGMLIPANKGLNDLKEDEENRDEVEQWMIEAIKSAGINTQLMEYIRQLSEEI